MSRHSWAIEGRETVYGSIDEAVEDARLEAEESGLVQYVSRDDGMAWRVLVDGTLVVEEGDEG